MLAIIASRTHQTRIIEKWFAAPAIRVDAVGRQSIGRVFTSEEFFLIIRTITPAPAAWAFAARYPLYSPFCQHGTQHGERQAARLLMHDPLRGLPPLIAPTNIEE